MQNFNDYYKENSDIEGTLEKDMAIKWNPNKIIIRDFGFDNLNRKHTLPFKVFDQLGDCERIETFGPEDFQNPQTFTDQAVSEVFDRVDDHPKFPDEKKIEVIPEQANENDESTKKKLKKNKTLSNFKKSRMLIMEKETAKKLLEQVDPTHIKQKSVDRSKSNDSKENKEKVDKSPKKFNPINLLPTRNLIRNISHNMQGSMYTDNLSKKPSKILKNDFGKDIYSSYWKKCIERILKEDDFTETVDVGYYTLFYMDHIMMAQYSSLPIGGGACEEDFGSDFMKNEKILKNIYNFWKKVDYDIDYDDNRLHNHLKKEDLNKLNEKEPNWKYRVPFLVDYGLTVKR